MTISTCVEDIFIYILLSRIWKSESSFEFSTISEYGSCSADETVDSWLVDLLVDAHTNLIIQLFSCPSVPTAIRCGASTTTGHRAVVFFLSAKRAPQSAKMRHCQRMSDVFSNHPFPWRIWWTRASAYCRQNFIGFRQKFGMISGFWEDFRCSWIIDENVYA